MFKIDHKKLRPVEDQDLLDENIVVRFPKEELKKRFMWVSELGACQVCDVSWELDIPHHARQGLGVKDDRYLVNICLNCHREIHTGSFSNLKKTRKEVEAIGWENHLEYLREIK